MRAHLRPTPQRSRRQGRRKDDPIDALKLAQARAADSSSSCTTPRASSASFSNGASRLYHDRIRNRVRQANRVIAQARLYGVMIRESDFAEDTAAVFKQLPKRKAVRRLPDAA
ncbi:MAG: hypothetical protein IPM64_09020 [Phycisphaerales bacterium]|nr:hypothetical protein [Phycisphaerales bacterium]